MGERLRRLDWKYYTTIGVIALFLIKVWFLPDKVKANEGDIETLKKVDIEQKVAMTSLASTVDKYVAVQEVRENGRDKREKLLIEMIREMKDKNGQ